MCASCGNIAFRGGAPTSPFRRSCRSSCIMTLLDPPFSWSEKGSNDRTFFSNGCQLALTLCMELAHPMGNILPFYPKALTISSFPSLRSTRGFGLQFQTQLVPIILQLIAQIGPIRLGRHFAYFAGILTHDTHAGSDLYTFSAEVQMGSEIPYKGIWPR